MSLGDDDDTPIIDEGYVARALQIDWSYIEKFPPAVVQCRERHKEYRSHSKYDPVTSKIIARLGCPVCHTHELARTSVVEAPHAVAGVLEREPQKITAADVGALELDKIVIDPIDES